MVNMPKRVMNKSVDEIYSGNQRFLVGEKVMFEDVRGGGEGGKTMLVENSCLNNVSCSDESSSIGKNSDLSDNSSEKSGDGEEVQSSYKGPLDAMESLEEVLPIRRSISRFYSGKSKSFASLAEATSIKEIAKPENAYMRKRRNLLSYNLNCNWDKTTSSPLKGGISKRLTNSSRTTLALAVAMTSCSSQTECNGSLHRKDFPTWRSFSLADLQHTSAVSISSSSEMVANKS